VEDPRYPDGELPSGDSGPLHEQGGVPHPPFVPASPNGKREEPFAYKLVPLALVLRLRYPMDLDLWIDLIIVEERDNEQTATPLPRRRGAAVIVEALC
jgi:hypothetical protein